ncbi:putative PSP1-like protein [Frankia canadensis]|uniref:Putative PSP1-like protein n=2 Tax=Frankia canadensis TaxID=1836972 RepID=A0A2I2KM31_9ACTN|nr:putative PSP1-like protein [Frankia canadensis]SOU54009.1 putative PSP1-like protein [Frankia canadensis]
MMCAVVFSPRGRLYYADPGPLTPRVGDHVLMPTDDGPEVATCMWAPQWVSDDVGGLPVLVGMALEEDLRRSELSRRRRARARVAARRLAREHDLPMKIVGVDHTPESGGYTVFFTAEGRVDFRGLVRDLNRTLAARVRLRQLSARDGARAQGGIGSCGRDLCCATFLTDFEPVSLRMARDQHLALNPMRISGACGRLMCCLRYEHPLYEEFAQAVPAVGERACTPHGEGRVVRHDVPRQEVVVALDEGGRTSCERASVCGARAAHDAAYPRVSAPRPSTPSTPTPSTPTPSPPTPSPPTPSTSTPSPLDTTRADAPAAPGPGASRQRTRQWRRS